MGELRHRIMACLGRFPTPVAPEPQVIRTEPKEGYTRHLVEYQVEEGERVLAYLLVPDGLTKPVPAVLAIHGHGGKYYLGKFGSAGLNQNRAYHYGLELCQRGYVVLCPDLLCFADRRPLEFERVENRRLADSNYERFIAGKLILEGSCMQAKNLSDLARAVDYLQALEYVDPQRIGCIGYSLGGQETTWFTWFEPRVEVGVSNCGYTTYRATLRDRIPHSPSFSVPGFLQVCDIDLLVGDICPKPFMMLSATEDEIFPVDGVREIEEVAGHVYAKAGVSERFQTVFFEGGHSFPEAMRQAAYEWLDRWL